MIESGKRRLRGRTRMRMPYFCKRGCVGMLLEMNFGEGECFLCIV